MRRQTEMPCKEGERAAACVLQGSSTGRTDCQATGRTGYRNRDSTRCRQQAGFTLVEALGAILITSLMLALFGTLWQKGSEWLAQAGVAAHLQQVHAAFEDYVQARESELAASATAASGPVFTTADLVEAGLLPEGFVHTNAWTQRYELTVRRITVPAAGSGDASGDSSSDSTDGTGESSQTAVQRLLCLVLTRDGRGTEYDTDNATFFNVLVPGTAARAGTAAGYIPLRAPDGADSSCLVSGQGSYVLQLAELGIASPGPGHLGACSIVSAGTTLDDSNYLHRVEVPGHPELNQMETVLDMTGHGIADTGYLQFSQTGLAGGDSPLDGGSSVCSSADLGKLFLDEDYGLYLCRRVEGSDTPQLVLVSDSANALSVQTMTLAADNELVTKPVCAPGTYSEPQIFVAPSIVSSGPVSPAMAAVRAWASSESDTAWRVHIRVKNTGHSTDDWYAPAIEGTQSLSYGAVQVITACVRRQAGTESAASGAGE